MIAELMSNKWLWAGVAVVAGLLVYRLFFSKDKATELLENEYEDIVGSDKYKVKGQFD